MMNQEMVFTWFTWCSQVLVTLKAEGISYNGKNCRSVTVQVQHVDTR